MTGKQAFSFYNRTTGKSVRLVLKAWPEGVPREKMLDWFMNQDPKDLFDVKEVRIQLPEHARIFENYTCEQCGEATGSNWIRIRNGKKLCLDCFQEYDRFHV